MQNYRVADRHIKHRPANSKSICNPPYDSSWRWYLWLSWRANNFFFCSSIYPLCNLFPSRGHHTSLHFLSPPQIPESLWSGNGCYIFLLPFCPRVGMSIMRCYPYGWLFAVEQIKC